MNRNIYQNISPYEVGIIQSRATRNIIEFRATILKAYNLTAPEWFVLGYVASHTPQGGIKVGEIATELDVQSTYVTGMLRRLEAKALVRARTSTHDRRARLVTATEKGEQIVAKIETDFAEKCKTWLGNVSDATFRSYLTVLKKLAQDTPELNQL